LGSGSVRLGSLITLSRPRIVSGRRLEGAGCFTAAAGVLTACLPATGAGVVVTVVAESIERDVSSIGEAVRVSTFAEPLFEHPAHRSANISSGVARRITRPP
jgi:hypothetical protein